MYPEMRLKSCACVHAVFYMINIGLQIWLLAEQMEGTQTDDRTLRWIVYSLLVIVPLGLVNAVSVYWLYRDGSQDKACLTLGLFLHLVLLGPPWRSAEFVKTNVPYKYKRICTLRYLQAFTQDIPSTVMLLMNMLQGPPFRALCVFTVTMNLSSATFSVVCYAYRNIGDTRRRYETSFRQCADFCIKFLLLSPRLFACAVLLSCYGAFVLPAMMGHMGLILIAYLFWQLRKNFQCRFDTSAAWTCIRVIQIITTSVFDISVDFVYKRWKQALGYYVLCFVEHGVITFFWANKMGFSPETVVFGGVCFVLNSVGLCLLIISLMLSSRESHYISCENLEVSEFGPGRSDAMPDGTVTLPVYSSALPLDGIENTYASVYQIEPESIIAASVDVSAERIYDINRRKDSHDNRRYHFIPQYFPYGKKKYDSHQDETVFKKIDSVIDLNPPCALNKLTFCQGLSTVYNSRGDVACDSESTCSATFCEICDYITCSSSSSSSSEMSLPSCKEQFPKQAPDVAVCDRKSLTPIRSWQENVTLWLEKHTLYSETHAYRIMHNEP